MRILSGIALFLAWTSAALAQRSALPATNPLQTLPQVAPPPSGAKVLATVQPAQNPALTRLLAVPVTPQRFDIAGVRAMAFKDVAALFAPLQGKPTTVSVLLDAARRCSQLYQDKGYALSFCYVPEQDFNRGVVRINAIEGYVAAVDIDGDVGSLGKKIRAIARHIQTDRPLRKVTFDRYVQILGLLPGAQIAANIPAPTTTDGATRLSLNVKRKRLDGNVGIDFNHPGIQGLISGTENALTPLGERVSVSALYPPGRGDQQFQAIGYSQLLGSDGLNLKLDGSHFSGNPDIHHNLPDYLDYRLRQEQAGVTLTYPLLLSGTRSLLAGTGLYGTDQHDRYYNRITGAQLEQRADTRVLHLDLDYTSASAKRVRRLSVSVGRGLDALGARAGFITNLPGVVLAAPNDTRFTRLSVSASQVDSWSHQIGTVLSVGGQYTSAHLPTSEQISFGGPRYGLAYEPGTISGDSGWGASAEVNRSFAAGLSWLKTLTPYATLQRAKVYFNNLEGSYFDALSTGALGLRFSDNRHYAIDLSAGQPIGPLPPYMDKRKPRYGLSFSYQLR